MKTRFFLISLLFFWILAISISSCSSQDLQNTLTGPYFGQPFPGDTPELFAPPMLRSNNEWFWHGALSISPDQSEFYLDIYYPNANPAGMRIRQMNMQNNRWSLIQEAPFAGDYVSAGMSFTKNGERVFFTSDRPGGFIWTSVKVSGTWRNPVAVSYPNPTQLGPGWCVSVAKSGRIYTHLFAGNTSCHIYTIDYAEGRYSAPRKMSDNINSSDMDINAFVDPDEEYLIFSSTRSGGLGDLDLYISFKKADGTWTRARNLGFPINTGSFETSPYVTPDKEFLFFLSERDGDRNPYWVKTSLIDSLKHEILAGITPAMTHSSFQLEQNYPNPVIDFGIIPISLSSGMEISLDVFDSLGVRAASLVNHQWLNPGRHLIPFYGESLEEGLYYYTLKNGQGHTETKKMIILR